MFKTLPTHLPVAVLNFVLCSFDIVSDLEISASDFFIRNHHKSDISSLFF